MSRHHTAPAGQEVPSARTPGSERLPLSSTPAIMPMHFPPNEQATSLYKHDRAGDSLTEAMGREITLYASSRAASMCVTFLMPNAMV